MKYNLPDIDLGSEDNCYACPCLHKVNSNTKAMCGHTKELLGYFISNKIILDTGMELKSRPDTCQLEPTKEEMEKFFYEATKRLGW